MYEWRSNRALVIPHGPILKFQLGSTNPNLPKGTSTRLAYLLFAIRGSAFPDFSKVNFKISHQVRNMGASTHAGIGEEQEEGSAPPPYSLVADGGLVAESGNVQGRSSDEDNDLSGGSDTRYRRRPN